MNIKFSFIITLLSGLSTMLGTFLILFKSRNKIISNSLSFASGVMISICIIDLIPNSYILINKHFLFIPTILFIILFIIIGVVLDIIIDHFIDSNNKLYKIGILSMLALIIHNIPEGIITFISSSINIKIGLTLSLAIALHNVPEGILISIPIYYSSKSRKKAIFYTFIAGISEFFGALIAYMFFNKLSNDYIMGFIYSFTSGLMLYIAIYEIPLLLKEYKNRGRVGSFVFGILLILLTHLFFN